MTLTASLGFQRSLLDICCLRNTVSDQLRYLEDWCLAFCSNGWCHSCTYSSEMYQPVAGSIRDACLVVLLDSRSGGSVELEDGKIDAGSYWHIHFHIARIDELSVLVFPDELNELVLGGRRHAHIDGAARKSRRARWISKFETGWVVDLELADPDSILL